MVLGAVLPGPVVTALLDDWPKAKMEEALANGSLMQPTEVAEAVVEGIKQMSSRENVKLDIRNPQSFMPETDNELAHCFGTKPDSDAAFKKEFGQLLNTLIKDYPDLDIVGAEDVPLIVPADYAAFSVLAD